MGSGPCALFRKKLTLDSMIVPEEGQPLLEAMADKGVIRPGEKGCVLLPLLPGIFENALLCGGETPWHVELARIVDELFETGCIRRYIETPAPTASTFSLS